MKKILYHLVIIILSSCNERQTNKNFESIKGIEGNGFVSEQTMFSSNTTNPELIFFPNEFKNETIKLSGYSPQLFKFDAKISINKEANNYKLRGLRRIYGNEEIKFDKKQIIEEIRFNDEILTIKPVTRNELVYYKLDSVKINKDDLKILKNNNFSITGDYLKNKQIDSLIIEIEDSESYPLNYILLDANKKKIGNSSFHYNFTGGYPRVILYDFKEFIGFPFFGFITEIKDNKFTVKVLIDDQWEHFYLELI